MQETVQKLKNLKNATQYEVTKVIHEQAYKSILKELKEDGININDLSDEEFTRLLKEEIKRVETFSKGALVGGGAILLLGLIG